MSPIQVAWTVVLVFYVAMALWIGGEIAESESLHWITRLVVSAAWPVGLLWFMNKTPY